MGKEMRDESQCSSWLIVTLLTDTKGHEGGRQGAGARAKGKAAFLDNGVETGYGKLYLLYIF